MSGPPPSSPASPVALPGFPHLPFPCTIAPGRRPARLNFVRQESASCSEMVLLPAFNKSAKLPEGETVPVEFLPKEPGGFDFACRRGMLRGKITVE